MLYLSGTKTSAYRAALAALVLFASQSTAFALDGQVLRAWANLGQEMNSCIGTAALLAHTSVQAWIAANIVPSDERLSAVVRTCQQLTQALKRGYECQVKRPDGTVAKAICNQVWGVRDRNGVHEISASDAYTRAFKGESAALVGVDHEVQPPPGYVRQPQLKCGNQARALAPANFRGASALAAPGQHDDWHQAVEISLNYYAPYPPDALAKGEEGTVIFNLNVRPTGEIISAVLAASSHHKDLDDAALAYACSLSPLKPPPPGLPHPSDPMGELPPDAVGDVFRMTFWLPSRSRQTELVGEQQATTARSLDAKGLALMQQVLALFAKQDSNWAAVEESAVKLFTDALHADPTNPKIAWHLRMARAPLPVLGSNDVLDSYYCEQAASALRGGAERAGDYPFDCRAGNTGYVSMARGPERARAMAQAFASSAENVRYGEKAIMQLNLSRAAYSLWPDNEEISHEYELRCVAMGQCRPR